MLDRNFLFEKLIAEKMKSPEFRRGWYRAEFRAPLPLRVDGGEYRRRRRRR